MKKKILCFMLVLSLVLPNFMVVANAMSVSGGAGTNQVYVEFYSDSSFTKRINSIKKGNYFYALLSMKDFSYFWGGDFKLGFNSNIARLDPEFLWWQDMFRLDYIHNDQYPVASNSSESIEFTVIEENHSDGTGLHTISIGNTSVLALRFKATGSGNFNLYLKPNKYLPKGYQCFTGLSVNDEIDINYKCTSLTVADRDIPVTGVFINGTEHNLTVGSVTQLTAVYSPSNATDKSIKWSSSNTSVATVDSNGWVTGKSAGRSVISAQSRNGVSANYVITVENKSSILNYDSFGYSFFNSGFDFGYPYHLENGTVVWDYSIPAERYMQAGFSKNVAISKEENNKWAGNCFGMSASSILFYKNALQEERYKADVSKPVQFDAPDAGNWAFLADKWEVKLRHMIELFQSVGVCGAYKFNDSSIQMMVEEIDSGRPFIMNIVGNKGGHEIVVYGYTKTIDRYVFNIYDCSRFVTEFRYENNKWSFEYVNEGHREEYAWRPAYIRTYDHIFDVYNKLYMIGDNSTTLFSVCNEPAYTYIFRSMEDLTLTNSSGQVSTIVDGEVSGEIDDIRIIPSSYLAKEPRYTIVLPTDTYTIVGKGDEAVETSFADDYMSADVTVKSNTPITISSDLKEIRIDTTADEEYSVTYTTYDNIFDEMTLSGISNGIVSSKLNENEIVISGVNTMTALASVSESVVSANSRDLTVYNEVTVKCEEDEVGTTIQILNADNELTEKVDLPERMQIDAPACDLESGTYTEGQTLSFTKDDETIIYYTTDGSIPSADNGIIYSMPVEINKSMTIKAVATKYGYIDSDIITLEYTLPEISPPFTNYVSGEYDDVLSLELMSDSPEDEIYYTLDGTDPIENGVLYTVPINIFEDTDILAYTIRNGCISEVSEYNYTISHKQPFYFENTALNQNNDIITLENIGDLTAVNVSVKKLFGGEASGNFFAAFYDDNKLIAVAKQFATISKDNDIITIKVTEDVSEANKIKLLAWNEAIIPLGKIQEQQIYSSVVEQ